MLFFLRHHNRVKWRQPVSQRISPKQDRQGIQWSETSQNSTLMHILPIIKVPKFLGTGSSRLLRILGKTRFDRLLHIGTTSILLAPEALRYAVAEAKQGRDIRRYDAAVSAIREIMPGDRNATPDVAWKEKVNKQIKAESDRLETELKGYKNNLIKESIRVRNIGCCSRNRD